MAMSKTAKIFLIVGGVIFALLIIGVIGIAIIVDQVGRASCRKTAFWCSMFRASLPDHSVDDPLARAFGVGEPKSFSSLLTQLRKAKVDSRVGAVLLDINFPGIGWGKADELARCDQRFQDFRQTGLCVYGTRDEQGILHCRGGR